MARYASAGAVYRELLQNSNDAEATTAEIHFSTVPTPNGQFVNEVVYRNNGIPFRPQDWSRLQKIAEGNPDVAKVGAFGVGAYTMFSIAEEPLVISGTQALAFTWKGDALWVKSGDSPHAPDEWTSFVLPSRDPYPLPNMVEFGRFLCNSLTFTQCLRKIVVFVNKSKCLSVKKADVKKPRIVQIPQSSWWNNAGARTRSPEGIFSLANDESSFMETTVQIEANINGTVAKKEATYVFAEANVKVPHDMRRRMIRVTKKEPPSRLKIQVFTDAGSSMHSHAKNDAARIIDAFSPRMGNGSIFIGFKTSQTTGLAAHLAAPFIPTVEREAIDLQDPTLMKFNSELLYMGGVVMRLTLEHRMLLLNDLWEQNKEHREELKKQRKLKREDSMKQETSQTEDTSNNNKKGAESSNSTSGFSFARFMASGARKIAEVISSVDLRTNKEDLLNFSDSLPLSTEEKQGVVLMRAFSPQQSTPDSRVGAYIAGGFEKCLPSVAPPILTQSGVIRGTESKLPHAGMERFVQTNVVRKPILKNAEAYCIHVAGSRPLLIEDLIEETKKHVLEEDQVVALLKWWSQYAIAEPQTHKISIQLRESIRFKIVEQNKEALGSGGEAESVRRKESMSNIRYYISSGFAGNSSDLPMPNFVLPRSLQSRVTTEILSHKTFQQWFRPLTFTAWFSWIVEHPALVSGEAKYESDRIAILAMLSTELSRTNLDVREETGRVFHNALFPLPCVPCGCDENGQIVTEKPGDLYLASAELSVFAGIAEFKKVPTSLQAEGVTEELLIAIGVRRAIAVELLLTHLDTLKWNNNPKPLVTYLQSAELSEEDMDKLRTIQYLPEVSDKERLYSPQELHLPHTSLALFPFVKVLQWPTSERFNEHSKEAAFLKTLGCMDKPPLTQVLSYAATKSISDDHRLEVLAYVLRKLSDENDYKDAYKKCMDLKFLPTKHWDLRTKGSYDYELQSPDRSFISSACLCMGFSVVNESVTSRCGYDAAVRFGCKLHPLPGRLVTQLFDIATFAKKRNIWSSATDDVGSIDAMIMDAFVGIFNYLNSRLNEFSNEEIQSLKKGRFIPSKKDDKITWHRADEVYFKKSNDSNGIASALFPVIEYNPFLSAIGVREEPSVEHICDLLLSSPKEVLGRLGSEEKYRLLLRRIASNPPPKVTWRRLKMCPFLLGYTIGTESTDNEGENVAETTEEAKRTYILAKAADICIIDNSLFAQMFRVVSAPQETDLEKFYEGLGSLPLSKCIVTQHTVSSKKMRSTPLTEEFSSRLKQRAPILISPSVTSRSLVPNAESILSEQNLTIIQVADITAHYKFKGETRSQAVTCCSWRAITGKHTLYMTENLEWYDVGLTLGKLILQRCNVEDAFFLGVIFESSLSQLKARGFPVDRIIRAAEPAPDLEIEDKDEYHPQQSDTTSQNPTQTPKDPQPDNNDNPSQTTENSTLTSQLSKGNNVSKHRKNSQASEQSKGGLDIGRHRKGLLGRALRSISGKAKHQSGLGGAVGSTHGEQNNSSPQGQSSAHSVGANQSNQQPEKPVNDSATNQNIEALLHESIRSTRDVSSSAVFSPDREVSISQEVQKSNNCEVIAGKDLIPCKGPSGSRKTSHGFRVFAARNYDSSSVFLQNNWNAVEAFSTVLVHISSIYGLRPESVAIFHEPTGKTIAFNRDRALYFNVRFFCSLHYRVSPAPSLQCFSYWYTTAAHELAHNIVQAHDQQHGFFTESFISVYMTKFINVISPLHTS